MDISRFPPPPTPPFVMPPPIPDQTKLPELTYSYVITMTVQPESAYDVIYNPETQAHERAKKNLELVLISARYKTAGTSFAFDYFEADSPPASRFVIIRVIKAAHFTPFQLAPLVAGFFFICPNLKL